MNLFGKIFALDDTAFHDKPPVLDSISLDQINRIWNVIFKNIFLKK